MLDTAVKLPARAIHRTGRITLVQYNISESRSIRNFNYTRAETRSLLHHVVYFSHVHANPEGAKPAFSRHKKRAGVNGSEMLHKWRVCGDSNPRPSPPEGGTLSS